MTKETKEPVSLGAFRQRVESVLARCEEFKVVPTELRIGSTPDDFGVVIGPETLTEESVRRLSLVYGNPAIEGTFTLAWGPGLEFTAWAGDEEQWRTWRAWIAAL